MAAPFIEDEIAEQPDVLRRVLSSTRPHLEALVDDSAYAAVDPKSLSFVGCGDMYFAAETVAWIARLHCGARAQAWRSMDLCWNAGQLGPDDLVVCASVSGRTSRTIEAARLARRAGAHVIGITDNGEAPLSREVSGVALLNTSPKDALAKGQYPGYHHQIAQTKTYTAVLLAELLVVTRATGVSLDLDSIPDRIAMRLPELDAAIRDCANDCFSERPCVVVLASGPHLGTALYGRAKFLEYAIPASAQCVEEFNHLEMFVSDERTIAIVLAPDETSRCRATELLEPWEDLGLRSIVIGAPGDYPGTRTTLLPIENDAAHVAPFVFSLALQLLAYRGAVALGRDPNRWLGGVRTDLINRVSRRTIRG